MLYLSDPPELEEIFPPPPPVCVRGPENFDRFVSTLRSFVPDALHFYHSREDFWGFRQGVR